jgi:hypothetical protein
MTDPYAPPIALLEPPSHAGYFAVSKRKLVIMLIGTSCLYAVYWFYRQWKAYAQSTGGSQWPWARGFFWWVFAYNLFGKLDEELRARAESVNWSHRQRGVALAVTGLGATIVGQLGLVYSLLPSILVVIVATYTLAGTLPVVNRLANDIEGVGNCRLTWANWLWLLAGAIMWIIAIGGVALILADPEALAG